jgi:predicted peptidase
MPRPAAALLGALLPAVALAADKPATGFLDKTFTNADGTTSPYVLFVPKGYDGTKPYPVILFLHGSGETKGGKKMPVEVGIATAVKKREKDFPFLVVIPQAETKGWQADGPNGKRAVAILDAVLKDYKVDPKRQYLTGLSMGGGGAWSLAAAHPDRWAAVVPICSPGNPADADKIKGIPVWSFVGDQDKEGTVAGMKGVNDALKKLGAPAKHTVYPGVPHNSWDRAYDTDELYAWLLEQQKK